MMNNDSQPRRPREPATAMPAQHPEMVRLRQRSCFAMVATLLLACAGCIGSESFRHPPVTYGIYDGLGDLLTAYTYREPGVEIVERFDIEPEIRIDAVVHDGILYAPESLANRAVTCSQQGACLEPFATHPVLVSRLLGSPLHDGSFLVADVEALFEGGSATPLRIAFAVRHPDCFGPTCPYEPDAAITLQTPWWPEARFMEWCPVEGGSRSVRDVLTPVPGEPDTLRLLVRGPFGLRPARDPLGTCIRHERPSDYVSVDSTVRVTFHQPYPNCWFYPEECTQ